MAHVSRGDTVVVTKGRERGKQGKIKRVLTAKGRVEIENVMMVKKHVKASQKDPQGGIKDIEGTVNISNVSLWCGTCSKAVRSKKVVDDAGKKSRACVKCDTTFPNPGM
ncbi:MAG: 50S ribosomal protein L24 [Kofleriaceae bacterium]|nr:50S ribosomal protein L24 [Kofleriaceae bacterium]